MDGWMRALWCWLGGFPIAAQMLTVLARCSSKALISRVRDGNFVPCRVLRGYGYKGPISASEAVNGIRRTVLKWSVNDLWLSSFVRPGWWLSLDQIFIFNDPEN